VVGLPLARGTADVSRLRDAAIDRSIAVRARARFARPEVIEDLDLVSAAEIHAAVSAGSDLVLEVEAEIVEARLGDDIDVRRRVREDARLDAPSELLARIASLPTVEPLLAQERDGRTPLAPPLADDLDILASVISYAKPPHHAVAADLDLEPARLRAARRRRDARIRREDVSAHDDRVDVDLRPAVVIPACAVAASAERLDLESASELAIILPGPQIPGTGRIDRHATLRAEDMEDLSFSFVVRAFEDIADSAQAKRSVPPSRRDVELAIIGERDMARPQAHHAPPPPDQLASDAVAVLLEDERARPKRVACPGEEELPSSEIAPERFRFCGDLVLRGERPERDEEESERRGCQGENANTIHDGLQSSKRNRDA